MKKSPPPASAEVKSDSSSEKADLAVQVPEFSYEFKIPKDRVAVLIGEKGQIKRALESRAKVKIVIDSKEGDVSITGKDSLALFSLREVISAIGRGFNPEIAQLLFKADYLLEIISLNDYSRHKNHVIRLRGRVIGAEGKSRVNIERLTETSIVVYGKTISIIGTNERTILAKRAIESILEGSPHANVYKWLEKSSRQLRRKEAFDI